MRASRGMGAVAKAKRPKGGVALARGGTVVPDKKKPPKKPAKPQLGLPLKQLKPRIPSKEFT